MSNNVITQNIAKIAGGSGISIWGSTSASIMQNFVVVNVENATPPFAFFTTGGSNQGGIRIAGSSNAISYLTSNTVALNTYIPPPLSSGFNPSQGTQFWVQDYGTVVASNNLFVGADTFAAVECVDIPVGTSTGSLTLTLSHNDVYTAAGPATYDGIRCAGLIGSNGNISADPLFLDPNATNPNFQLQLASPAVDAGLNTAVGVGLTDLTCAPRIQNAKGLPTAIIDMGAYEHAGVPSLPPAPDFALTLTPTTVSSSPTTPGWSR